MPANAQVRLEADRAAKKEARTAKRAESKARRRQIWQAFKIQRKSDKKLLPLMVVAFLLGVLVVVGIGLIFGVQWLVLPFGIVARRAGRDDHLLPAGADACTRKAEGQPGAAALGAAEHARQVAGHPGVAGTTQLDAVHRVIGRPGVILVGEGAPHRVKRPAGAGEEAIARVVGKTPIYDIIVGNDEGQVPLRKLQRHLMKLPRNISTGEMDSLDDAARRARLAGGRHCRRARCPPGAKMRSVQRDRPPPLTSGARARLSRGCGRRSCDAPVVQPAPVAVRASAGRTRASSAVRSTARGTPTSVDRSDATRMPSTAMPGVMPNAATATAVSTNQTPSTVHEKFAATPSASGPANSPAMRYAEQPVDGQRRQPAAEPRGRSRGPSPARRTAPPGSARAPPAGYAAVPGIHDSIQRATPPG